MKRQCQTMGWAIDWSRELATCDPAYYKWNQWFFLKMLEKGIAYRKTGVVNWDPVDQTVLANEQVIDGHGWRSGAPVEKREIPMYYLRITDYADELLSYLDRMPGWPERVKTMQANWIGKSAGRALRVPARHSRRRRQADRRRPDVRVHHARRHDHGGHVLRGRRRASARDAAAAADPKLAAFVDECRLGSVKEADIATMEKKGMPTGLFVTHPITRERIEVWVGNYVLMGYGDGAVMGVPAHDERDFAFAKKYGLPIRQVIRWVDAASVTRRDRPFSTDAWQPWYADIRRVHGQRQVRRPRLRRGRRCDRRRSRRAGPGREEDHVPAARLGHLAAALLGHADPDRPLRGVRRRAGAGEGPAGRAAGGLRAGRQRQSAREARATSSTRRARGAAGRRSARPTRWTRSSTRRGTSCATPVPTRRRWSTRRNDYWNPMDQYIGGITHAILHLLYARFWTKVMRDMGLVQMDEPFTRLLTQGMVLNHIYFRRTDKGGIDYFAPTDVEVRHDEAGRMTGARPQVRRQAGRVRRRGHDVEVQAERRRPAGHDRPVRRGCRAAVRDVRGAAGGDVRVVRRGRRRCAALPAPAVDVRGRRAPTPSSPRRPHPDFGATPRPRCKAARREIHSTLKQANYDYERIQYNTVVSAGMKMLNALEAVARRCRGAHGARRARACRS